MRTIHTQACSRSYADETSAFPEINASLKRRARHNQQFISRQTRSLIRCALETKDPNLAQVVRRVEGGEMTFEHVRLE